MMKKILTVLMIFLAAAVVFFAYKYFERLAPAGDIVATGWTLARQLDFAEMLASKGLKKEAIKAFEEYLDKSGLQLKQASKLFYRMGTMYMDLYDYERAAYYFYKAEAADPRADYKSLLSQKLVTCLENIGMTTQARYETEKRTSVAPAAEKRPADAADIVASVGDVPVMRRDVDEAMDELPDWMKSNFTSKEGRVDFIRQYAANEAMYQKAKRMGFEDDTDVRRGVAQFKKQMLVQKLIQQQLGNKINVSPQDVKMYYEAKKEKYEIEKKQDDGTIVKEQRPFEEVSELVEYEYKNQKMQEEMQKLLNNIMQEEGVRIYEERISGGEAAEEEGEIGENKGR